MALLGKRLKNSCVVGQPLQGSKKAAVAPWGKCTLSKKAAVALWDKLTLIKKAAVARGENSPSSRRQQWPVGQTHPHQEGSSGPWDKLTLIKKAAVALWDKLTLIKKAAVARGANALRTAELWTSPLHRSKKAAVVM